MTADRAIPNRFETFEVLGQSAKCTVYEGQDYELSRSVVVKELKPEFRQDEVCVAKFWAEATLLARMNQANIQQVYAVDRERFWIIMEPLRGALASEVTARGISFDRARDIIRQLLAGLEYLHRVDNARVEIRLDTILVDEDNRPKFTNISVADSQGEYKRPDHRRLHTAPEVLNPRHFGEPGPASDLYCLGIVILQLLAANKFASLFSGLDKKRVNDAMAWSAWHASSAAVGSIRSVRDDIPKDIEALIERLIEKQVGRRFSSSTEALEFMNQNTYNQGQGIKYSALDNDLSEMQTGTVASDTVCVAYNSPDLYQPQSVTRKSNQKSGWISLSMRPLDWSHWLTNSNSKRLVQLGLVMMLGLVVIGFMSRMPTKPDVDHADDIAKKVGQPKQTISETVTKVSEYGTLSLDVRAKHNGEAIRNIQIFIDGQEQLQQVNTATAKTVEKEAPGIENKNEANVIKIKKEPKTYSIVIVDRDNQFLSWQGTADVVADEEKYCAIELTRKRFPVHIDVQPFDSQWGVYGEIDAADDSDLDSLRLDKREDKVVWLPVGEYSLQLQAEGYEPVVGHKFHVKSTADNVVTFKMRKLAEIAVLIDSYPQGAEIVVDGVSIGTTPKHYTAAEGKMMRLELNKKGYVSVIHNLRLDVSQANREFHWYLDYASESLAQISGPN